jgi:CxxC-x17-CxxC domain-containing protein
VSQYQDKVLTCRDCGQEFSFTAGEQEFYAQRGYTNEPGRCPSCRSARKAQRGDSGGGFGGGGSSFGGGARREMFPAVCSACGKETQVPFQPRGDRPVYCSDCYSQQGGGSRGGGRSSGGGGGGWGRR